MSNEQEEEQEEEIKRRDGGTCSVDLDKRVSERG
jgi:hypothetical protein